MTSDPKHTVVVGCLVKRDDSRILLINSPKRGWEIPQGRVEEGEAVLDAARREVLEETGISAEPQTPVAVYTQTSPVAALVLTFLAGYVSGEPVPQEGESVEVGWFTGEEALALVSHPVNVMRLRDLLEYDGRMVFRSYASKPFRVLSEAKLG